jgi:ABC-type uncharacterized transport system substrate-binding protein
MQKTRLAALVLIMIALATVSTGRLFRAARILAYAAFASIALANPASAHPHVWITGHETVVFDAEGRIAAVQHAWVFDEMYSAFATQGVGKNGQLPTKEDLAPLAKTNVESLADYEYFTHAKADGKKVEFATPTEYSLEERQDKLVVLTFTVPLKTPVKITRFFSLQVYDPTYYVAFSLDEKDPVALAGAPQGCSTNVAGANPLAETDKQKMSEAFFANLSPGANFGVKLASSVTVACP